MDKIHSMPSYLFSAFYFSTLGPCAFLTQVFYSDCYAIAMMSFEDAVRKLKLWHMFSLEDFIRGRAAVTQQWAGLQPASCKHSLLQTNRASCFN